MTPERWEQLKSHLKKNFQVLEEKTEDLIMETGDGPVKQGDQEILVVQTNLGKMKVVQEVRPRVLEKKFHYTHRQGSAANAEYKFSETEKTYKMRIFKWDEGEDEWKELNADQLPDIVSGQS